MFKHRRRSHRRTTCSVMAGLLALSGCQSPLTHYAPVDLERQVTATTRSELKAVSDSQSFTVAPPETDLYQRYDVERVKKLDEISGPTQYLRDPLELPEGLDGQAPRTVQMSLRRVIELVLQNNLDVKFARLQPGITAAQITQAQAVFDATAFVNANFTKADSPQQATVQFNPITNTSQLVGANTRTVDSAQLQTGIRKVLDTGGQISFSAQSDYTNNKTQSVTLFPDPAWTSQINLTLTQPLLRNFGTAVNRAQISLTRNAHARDVITSLYYGLNGGFPLDQRTGVPSGTYQMTNPGILGDAERAYWELVFARRQLAIQQRLFKQTVETRDAVVKREIVDANPLQIAQAYTFVELRRADLVRQQQAVRFASDRLKIIINAPDLPLGDDVQIEPIDDPIEEPIQVNLNTSVTAALQKRPEIMLAILSIDDASIRQMVADNQRLPVLNLVSTLQYFGLSEQFEASYGNLTDGDFIQYIVGFQYEQPIGNRSAEAAYRQTMINRQLQVNNYVNTSRKVVLSVRDAIDSLRTSYKVIGVNRNARRLAAENLRAIQVREDSGEEKNPDFLLDLKLNTQQRLADAELGELQAVIQYNIAIMTLHQAQGTLLEHNQVQLEWPGSVFER